MSNEGIVIFGKNNDYLNSNVKKIVDAWSIKNFNDGDLKSQRLITLNELIDGFGYKIDPSNLTDTVYTSDSLIFDFLILQRSYYTMSKADDSDLKIWFVTSYSQIRSLDVDHPGTYSLIRPVIELYKCAIDDNCDDNDKEDIDDNREDKKGTDKEIINNDKSNEKVNVPNTLKSVSGLIILIGLVLVCAGLNIFMIVKSRSNK